MADTIKCDVHGPQQETFVCGHLFAATRAAKRVGFHTAVDPDNPRPDAWCDGCEKRFQDSGGDWEGPHEKEADIKLLCGVCYDEIREFQSA